MAAFLFIGTFTLASCNNSNIIKNDEDSTLLTNGANVVTQANSLNQSETLKYDPVYVDTSVELGTIAEASNSTDVETAVEKISKPPFQRTRKRYRQRIWRRVSLWNRLAAKQKSRTPRWTCRRL